MWSVVSLNTFIKRGVPQGYILDPVKFSLASIFFRSIFYSVTETNPEQYNGNLSDDLTNFRFLKCNPLFFFKPSLPTTSFLTRDSLSETMSFSSAMICRSSGRLSLFRNLSSDPSSLNGETQRIHKH